MATGEIGTPLHLGSSFVDDVTGTQPCQGTVEVVLVHEVGRQQILELVVRRVGGGLQHECGQGGNPLTQIGARCLAGPCRRDVDDVVGELEHRTDLFAELTQ